MKSIAQKAVELLIIHTHFCQVSLGDQFTTSMVRFVLNVAAAA